MQGSITQDFRRTFDESYNAKENSRRSPRVFEEKAAAKVTVWFHIDMRISWKYILFHTVNVRRFAYNAGKTGVNIMQRWNAVAALFG
jgi:hypothetical protein